jgi:cytoskeletal protein CcmA (bactofilin family)
MTFWGPVMLSAATSTMLALPLVPSLTELRRRRDAAPLPTRSDDGKIENFALSMKEYMVPLAALEGKTFCTMRDGLIGRVLHREDVPALNESLIETPLFAPHSLVFPLPVCVTHELYVRGNLQLANDSMIRAALVEGDATLGERTTVVRWIHVGRDLEAGPDARLFGRASSAGTLTLRRGTSFERLRAATICMGTQTTPLYDKSPIWKGASLIDMRLGRVRSNGDFHLRDSDAFQGHIVAAGKVSIGENVLVIGSVKARTDAEIGSGTQLEGTVVSRGRMSIGSHCYIKGPVLSEREIVIGPGTQIGTPGCLTTVSAPKVRIAPGAVVCGSIWARESGEVTA